MSLLRLDPVEFVQLDEQDSIVLNSTLTSPKALIELPTKNYVDSLHESSRNDKIYHQYLLIRTMNLVIIN